LNLTGLDQDEAELIVQQYLDKIKRDLNSGIITPNAGDMIHHVIRINWGNQGLISGLQRGKVLSNYSIAMRLKGDIMYLVLRKEN